MSVNSVVALIPLRGGSKGIPDKNIKPIAGKPLCAWVLEAACACEEIEQVYVSTDSEKIAEIVEELPLDIKVIARPPALATDQSSTEDVILHFAQQVPFDVLVTIQATSPLLGEKHLTQALKRFKTNNDDSMLSAVRIKRFFWNEHGKPLNYDPLSRPRRQDFNGTLVENGAFYITKRTILNKFKSRLGGSIGVYEMPEESFIEIDEMEDWVIVETLLKLKNGQI